MDKGNWVPLDKRLVSFLPKIADNRPYTKLEAMFSLSVDYDNSTSVSIAGYARLWKWNRNTVSRFFVSIGVEISYPDSTSKKQNQRGQIGIQIRDRSGTDKGQIRIIDNSDLMKEKIRCGTDKGQIRDRSVSATIYPNPKPNPKPSNKKPFVENSNEFRLAAFLESHIIKNNPDFKKKNLQTWAKDFDLLLRIDKRDLSEAKELIEWCQSDTFWMTNILCPSKFRKQYDQLKINSKKPKGKPETRTLMEMFGGDDDNEIEVTDYEIS